MKSADFNCIWSRASSEKYHSREIQFLYAGIDEHKKLFQQFDYN